MTNWKKICKPDAPYFGEQDFDDLNKIIVVTIKSHKVEMVTNEKGTQKKGVLHFAENVKPLILNVTNGKTIRDLYGRDADLWIGKKIALWYDQNVKVAGKKVGGTRVKAVPKSASETPKCEICGKEIKATTKMTAEQVAEYGKKTHGKQVCLECGKKLTEEKANGIEQK